MRSCHDDQRRLEQLAGQNVILHACYQQNGRNHQESITSSSSQSLTAKRSGHKELEMNKHGNYTALEQPGAMLGFSLN